MYQCADPFFRSAGFRPEPMGGIFPRKAEEGILQDVSVQTLLIAEVVVDGGDIRAGAPADISDAGAAKALINKHFSGRF